MKNRGEYYLKVFFVNHQGDTSKCFWSNKSQDKSGVSVDRFMSLVKTGKWAGLVNWAAIFNKEGTKLREYSKTNDLWRTL